MSIPEESTLVNRFFTLQKDVERRSTLSSLMKEHEVEIIGKWLEYLQGEMREDEMRIGRMELHDLLVGIRAFFVPKENESLHSSLEKIQHQLASDQAAYFQLIMALYVFPSAVRVCKRDKKLENLKKKLWTRLFFIYRGLYCIGSKLISGIFN